MFFFTVLYLGAKYHFNMAFSLLYYVMVEDDLLVFLLCLIIFWRVVSVVNNMQMCHSR